MNGYYVNLNVDNHDNLVIKPTEDMLESKDEILSKPFDEQCYMLLEDYYGNGWSNVRPEDIGALTSAFILTDDYTIDDDGNFEVLGSLWSDIQYYQIRSWVDDLFSKKVAVLFKVQIKGK